MEKQFVQIEIIAKRSTENDAISQEIVEKCIKIAHEAHFQQRDRDGNAVILHPLIVGSMGKTDAEKCVGFLHDVVEDSDWTFDDLLNEGLPTIIVDTLRLLTHQEGTDYYDTYSGLLIPATRLPSMSSATTCCITSLAEKRSAITI